MTRTYVIVDLYPVTIEPMSGSLWSRQRDDWPVDAYANILTLILTGNKSPLDRQVDNP